MDTDDLYQRKPMGILKWIHCLQKVPFGRTPGSEMSCLHYLVIVCQRTLWAVYSKTYDYSIESEDTSVLT